MQPDLALRPTLSTIGRSSQRPQKMARELDRLFPQSSGLPRAPQPAGSSLPAPLQVGKAPGKVGLGRCGHWKERVSSPVCPPPAWLVLPFLHLHQCPKPTWL